MCGIQVRSVLRLYARHVVDTDDHGRRTASGGGRAERLADGRQWWRWHVWPDSKRTATTRVAAGAFTHSVVANSWPPITGRETRITTVRTRHASSPLITITVRERNDNGKLLTRSAGRRTGAGCTRIPLDCGQLLRLLSLIRCVRS